MATLGGWCMKKCHLDHFHLQIWNSSAELNPFNEIQLNPFNGIQLGGFCLQLLRLNISAQAEMFNIQTDLNTWKDTANGTRVEEFILLGFPGTWQFRVSFVVIFTLMYTLTVIGNASIIALVWRSSNLHTPMYFFLCNLSFLEIWYTTGVVPKAIGVMLGTSQTISFSVCILQLFFLLSLGSTECFLLSVMAYDRYLAICYPLRYSSLMNSVLSVRLALSSWLGGFLAISLLAFLTSRLTFCGPDVINHFLCDIDSCLALSCSDTWPVELATFLVSIIVVVASCVVTLVSYMYIISSILRIQSAHGRKKAFSTCSAHLSVVTIWYGSTMFLYVKPSAQNSLDLNKIVNTFNTMVHLQPQDMSCNTQCRPCQPCGPTPLANSCNEPCVRQCQDSTVVIEPPAVLVTLPGPILSSFPQNTVVGSSTSAAVGNILSCDGVPINSGGFDLSCITRRYGGRRGLPC
ncbi:hypothetical protein DUI87_21985 [Hirundo rustica rustica]|uniref:G-protein coupled receptors family 1 profile domain-containing protein n=4 Tax=Passeriformes TaxID=9126 RepID=A0A3M0JR28_HIRRU|nr:hypothetical protein DUI87_21985 [Hirundo rustica rustica]